MEWISVKERLPENYDTVLIGCFKSIIQYSRIEDHVFLGYIKDGVFRAITDETFVTVIAGYNGGTIISDVDQSEVTHWAKIDLPKE